MRLLGDLTLGGLGKIRNALMDPVITDPITPAESQVWYNSTEKALKFYDGTAVQVLAIGGNTAQLQGEIDAIEAAAGLNSDGSFTAPAGTNYLGSATTLKQLSVLLDTQVKANADAVVAAQGEVDALEGVVSTLQNEVDAIETGVGLNGDGTWTAPAGANFIAADATVKAALTTLDGQAKTNADNIDLKVNRAGDSLGGDLAFQGTHGITGLRAAAGPTEPVRKAEFDAAMAGLDFQPDIDGLESDFAGVAGRYIFVDGTEFVAGATGASAGDIVVVDASGNVTSVAYDVSTAGEGAITWNRAEDVFYVFSGGAWGSFGGLSGVTAGVGLVKSGNTIDVNLGAGIGQLPTDEVGIDLRANSGLWLTEDGIASSTNAAAQLSLRLDGGTLALGANGVKVADQGVTENQLSASVAGDGLTGGAGTALAVGAGTGITVTADAVAFDEAYGDGRYANKTTTESALVSLGSDIEDVDTRLSNSYFLYDGSSSSASHVVNHNLNQSYPLVQVYDSNDKQILPDEITITGANSLTVSFSSAITCKVAVMAPLSVAA